MFYRAIQEIKMARVYGPRFLNSLLAKGKNKKIFNYCIQTPTLFM